MAPAHDAHAPEMTIWSKLIAYGAIDRTRPLLLQWRFLTQHFPYSALSRNWRSRTEGGGWREGREGKKKKRDNARDRREEEEEEKEKDEDRQKCQEKRAETARRNAVLIKSIVAPFLGRRRSCFCGFTGRPVNWSEILLNRWPERKTLSRRILEINNKNAMTTT